MTNIIQGAIASRSPSATDRERAIAITAAEIGAIIVARAVAKADPVLSSEILSASRRVLGEAGGARPRRNTRMNAQC
jgi:hypothetical protein